MSTNSVLRSTSRKSASYSKNRRKKSQSISNKRPVSLTSNCSSKSGSSIASKKGAKDDLKDVCKLSLFQTPDQVPPTVLVLTEEHKSMLNELNLMRKRYTSYIESIAIHKFYKKIIEIRKFRKEFIKLLHTIKTKKPAALSLPIREPLIEKLRSMESSVKTVADLLKVNSALQCRQLVSKPFLIPDQELDTNQLVMEGINQIMPWILDLDEDIEKLDTALRLIFPKMRDGELFGHDLLEELLNTMSNMQLNLIVAYSRCVAYNSQRADILTDICKLNHVEDFRLKLERYDYSYSMILLKAVNDIYTTYLVVYTLFRKNLDQIIEFRNVVNDETDSLTESIFM